MPQIIVTAGDTRDGTDSTVVLRERVNASDFESQRFATNLLERLGWAVEDATEAERDAAYAAMPDEPAEADYAWDPTPVGVA